MARKILLADDSVTAQNMGRRILSDAGYDVTTVNNGSAALKKIAESKPDLIVLDVYMPGYGGLEVCQRLREAPETARIPVLLTVGKLEPFKAEEARRVRADAFIVKPFEASELLTALTKLEDKIVPQAQPAKPGRFAKALAAADEFSPEKDFGNSETGWKNRLSIPPPHAKPRESEPEERPAASVRDAVAAEPHQPAEMKSGLEEALLSSLPQDVTEEEIAAIKAAAAAFSAPGDTSAIRVQPVIDQPVIDQAETAIHESGAGAENRTGAATFASASESPVDAIPANLSVAAHEQSAKPTEDVPVAEVPSLAETHGEVVAPITSESSERAATRERLAESRKSVDDEVTAALASLAPARSNGDASAAGGEPAKWGIAARDQVSVTMASATQEFNGPRWIAEPVSVMEDEATLALEQEMERAYAAFAAADAARMSIESSPVEPPSSVTEPSAANSDVSSSPVESVSISDSFESKPSEPAVLTAAEVELPVADASSTVAVSESAVAGVTADAAYAAAASASAGAAEPTMAAEDLTQPSSRVESSPDSSSSTESSEPRGESELAAAWANWRHIRESVIGSQLSSEIADTVAELNRSTSETQPDSRAEASSSTGEESSEISNIVDSVLADLKPKLMAEIAKKMGKEKKK